MMLEWSFCKKLASIFRILSSFDEELKDWFSLCNSTLFLSPILSTISTAVLNVGKVSDDNIKIEFYLIFSNVHLFLEEQYLLLL